MNEQAATIARFMAAMRRDVQALASQIGFEGISKTKGVDSLNAVLDDMTRTVGLALANEDETLNFADFLRDAGATFMKEG